jgi:low affinity Fe/Cu permease
MFDRFATQASGFVSRAWFFVLCVLIVVLWAPSFFLFETPDTWQLIINSTGHDRDVPAGRSLAEHPATL